MNWAILRILFFTIFSSMLGLGIVVPLLPVYAHDLGATNQNIGFIFGAFSFSLAIFSPIIGRLSDIKGRKKFIVFGMIVYFITSIGLMFSKDVTSLIITRFLQGIAAGLVTAAEAYAGDITPKGKEGLVMGLLNASFAAGLCAGPLIGGIAKDVFGIQTSFMMMGAVCLTGFFVCAIFLPREKKEYVADRKKISINYRELLSNQCLLGIFLFKLIYTMCIGAVWAFAPLIADSSYGMSGLAIGIIIMLGIFISALLMPATGILADIVSKRLLMGVGGMILVYGMIFFSRISSELDFYIVGVFIGFGNGISMPALTGMIVIIGRKSHSMGMIMSFLILGETLGMATGSILAGSLIDRIGMSTTFISMAAIMFVSTLAALFLTRVFVDSPNRQHKQ